MSHHQSVYSHVRAFFDIDALLIRITGLIALIHVPLRHLPRRLDDVVGFNIAATTRYSSLIVGLLLLYLASQIMRRKRTAYWLTVVALSVLIGLELLHFRNGALIALYGITIVSVIYHRKLYVVRSDAASLRSATVFSTGVILVLAAFAAIPIELTDFRTFGADLSVAQTIDVTMRALAGLAQPNYVELSHFGKHIVVLLHIAAIVSLLIILFSMFEPLRLRRPATRSQRRTARNLIERYSQSSEDFFKIWPEDKHYFFYGNSFLAYGLYRGTAIVLDGATGAPNDTTAIRKAFLEEARLSGWSVAVVHADFAETKQWQSLGMQSLFLGGEAVVDTKVFVSSTASSKHFRYIRNKSVKAGLEYALLQAPLTTSQITELRTISDAWLGNAGRREYQFSMGYFDEAYIAGCDVAVLRLDDRIVAYSNLIPSYARTSASVDHMRSFPDAPPVAMHYLLMELIKQLERDGIQNFNLGLAPLSRLDDQSDLGVSRPMLAALKTVGQRFYSIAGLEQFKGKFQPDWQPRYLVYQGAPTRLSAIAAALNSLTAFHGDRWNRIHKLLFGAGLAAAFGYAAFPLALFLNRPLFWDGLVSQLAAYGSPYNWVFNGLDIMSGIVGCILFGYLYYRLRHHVGRLYQASLIAAVLATFADFLTAIVILPHGYDGDRDISLSQIFGEPSILIHGLASFINSGAFLVSLLLWVIYKSHRISYSDPRQWLAAIALIIGVVGSIIGALFPPTSASLQRIFILIYAVWLADLAYDAVRRLAALRTART